MDLLVSGSMDAQGIRAQHVSLEGQPPFPVRVFRVTSFRSVKQVAVRLEVQAPEGAPWSMGGAVLKTDGSETPLKGWPPTPLPPGRSTLVLARKAGEGELKESYTLEVREAGGNRTILILLVVFP